MTRTRQSAAYLAARMCAHEPVCIDQRQHINRCTAHIRNSQERAVARFNLWAKEPTR